MHDDSRVGTKPTSSIPHGIAHGAAIGTSLGFAIGTATGDATLGLVLGASLGVGAGIVVEVLLDVRKRGRDDGAGACGLPRETPRRPERAHAGTERPP